MRILNIRGKEVSVNPANYLIDWDKIISKPQKKVSDFLRPYWQGQMVLSEFRIPGSLFRIDIFNVDAKVMVEVSPDELHKNYNQFLHKNRSGFLKKLKADNKKYEWADKAGYLLIELDTISIKNLSKDILAEKGLIL